MNLKKSVQTQKLSEPNVVGNARNHLELARVIQKDVPGDPKDVWDGYHDAATDYAAMKQLPLQT